MARKPLVTSAILLFVSAFGLGAADPPADRAWLTVDRIFGQGDFNGEGWGPARWLEDSSGYTMQEESETLEGGQDIVRYDPESGRREVLVRATALVPPGETKALSIADYAWSRDLTKLLVFTNTKRVWRQETRGDYWVLDRQNGAFRKLGGRAEPSTLMFATFSPDGRRVAYVCRNNVFVQSLDSMRIKQLTRDGTETIINGTADWVNEEEFFLRNGIRWSSDGRYLAYWQFDTSGVR